MSNINSTTALATLIEREMKISGLQPGKYPATAFAAYLELLTQWNKAYNLTAIRDHKKMITHHILDSLSVLPYLNGEYCMDIGTGAGLPGLILALSTPERYWYLLDSNQKKIRFVNQAIMELNIHNIETICCRIEDFHSDKYFSTIISRAFGRLSKFYQLSRHLLSPNGKLLAMKGADISEELAEMGQGTINMQVHTLRVPGITGRRSLVEINVLPTVN